MHGQNSVHTDVEENGGGIHSKIRTRGIPNKNGIRRGETVEDTTVDDNGETDTEIGEGLMLKE
ncbi:hypothetical protein PTKIN_Ptkin10aG0108700 [Pterospermum kingtungense]